MIFSVLLRNYKAYKGINYIPISNSFSFTALIGNNGIGKSSVLEALDSYFNSSDWNFNHNVIEKGFSEREPYICPIFILDKRHINNRRNIYKYLSLISDIMWQIEADDFNNSVYEHAVYFCTHRDKTREEYGIDQNTYFLFPIGIEKTSKTNSEFTMSIFSGIEDFQDRLLEIDIEINKVLIEIYDFTVNSHSYIYIPTDIDFTAYTKIEGDTVQALMGLKIDDIVKGFINENDIKGINQKLNDFMGEVSSTLVDYEYKKPARKQNMFNLSHFSSKVIEAYFETKILNYKGKDGNLTPVYQLSSGEKRKAILDIARSFLTNHTPNENENIIFAIDEPELSLHISSCFSQFEKLKDISSHGIQTIITTHWYGFMPILSEGCSIYISQNNDTYVSKIIDLRDFRGEIDRLKKETQGTLPSEVELKGIYDLVQSILSSITGSSYKWIICEGVSDKIYMQHFSKDKNDIIILPIGKSSNVKKIYNHMILAIEEYRDNINGKVQLIIDTDRVFESFNSRNNIPSISIKRLLNIDSTKTTSLARTSDTTVYPPTEIEDVLNANTFLETLKHFSTKPEHGDISRVVNNIRIVHEGAPSGLAFDLRESEKETIKNFFSKKGMKIKFALKYIELDMKKETPDWFRKIEEFLYN